MGTFVISKRSNGEYQFNLKAVNGQVILSSEGYKTKTSCRNGISSVIQNAVSPEKFERNTSSNNKSYFNLKASNGQVIGTSQMYESDSSCTKGIQSVSANVVNATIDDVTVEGK